MKMRMFHDLEVRGKNCHKELPSVLWALRININRGTSDTPFNLVYGAYAVLPPKNYPESTRVAHFNVEDQAEVRELDSNLLEERCNTALAKDKHKFSLPWEGPFIIVDIAAPGAYMLAEVDGGMLPNTLNVDQLHKYCAWCIYLINKDAMLLILHLLACYIIFQSIDQRGSSPQQQKW
jgi:hypothetical protein